ncbi:MAG: SDR family oxidoreductase [Nostocoides sp.]
MPPVTTLITGASSGIGAELARQLTARGEDVVLCARRVDRLEQLRASIVAEHPPRGVTVRALDVTDEPEVFRVFREVAAALPGGLDRVVVNAGIGHGAPIGSGQAAVNRDTVVTNVLGALAQTEAAMAIFRSQGHGHLVMVSSMSALRGMPKGMTAYAASKAFVAHLAEGIRSDVIGRDDLDITVTTVFPGYIRSEMTNRMGAPPPFLAETATGAAGIVAAIDKGAATARIPAWPWRPLGTAMKLAPLSLIRRFS